jgi:cytochrome c peroxidase
MTTMTLRALSLLAFSPLIGCDDPLDTMADAGSDADAPDSGGNTSRIELPATPYAYAGIELPAHFDVETELFHGQQPMTATDNMPSDNPVTDEGATLGRVLFYDRNLSQNRTIACASCHEQEHGFSDDRVFSAGFGGGETGRHSMGLTNARYGMEVFFWDGRADTLEDQTLMPLQDPVEMGMSLDEVVERVREADYYPALFEAAFGDSDVSIDRVARALAQFVRSIVSTQSRYDEGRAQAPARSNAFVNFTDEENHGKFLFSSPPPLGGFACFICHQGEGFVAVAPTSNGLDAEVTDRGLGAVTESPNHEATFRVPSLRNVAVRAPYMHDGRFATLVDVIDHYSEGIEASPNLGAPFGVIDGVVPQINMTDEEKAALVAFLHTLTDEALLSDPKFGDPFVRE